MRRLFLALILLIVGPLSAVAEFTTFDKTKFEELVKSNAPVVVHVHEWW
jgi:hypothetical protein